MFAGQPHFAGDGTNRDRIIAGNHATAHTLLTEPSERLLGILTDLLGTQHQRHRFGLRVNLWIVRISERCRGTRNQQHTIAVIGVVIDLLQHIRIITAERGNDDFWRTHVPGFTPAGGGCHRKMTGGDFSTATLRLAARVTSRRREDRLHHRTPFAGRRERNARFDLARFVALSL